MLRRRTFLLTTSGLGAWMGCSKTPPPPAFLSDLQFLSRDGTPLPETWTIPITHPIDPTMQYQIVAEHPLEHEGRQVVAPAEWTFIANVEQKGERLPIVGSFRPKKWFGEEHVGDRRGDLVWESPDCPLAIKPDVHWQWGHCRVPQPGRYTVIVYLLPTVIRIGGDDTMVDLGPGIEIVRQELIVAEGEPPQKGLSMSFTSEDLIPRSIHRKMRQRKKG